MLRIFMTTPDWWNEKYPEKLLKFSGTVPNIGRFANENQPLWKFETKIRTSDKEGRMEEDPYGLFHKKGMTDLFLMDL